MKNFLLIVLGLLTITSCHKLKGEEIEPYLGKWKCNGYIIGDHTYSPVYEVLQPYEDCYMEITKGKVIFTNHDEKLKVNIVNFEFGQHYPDGDIENVISTIIIKTRDIKGQKRELRYFFQEGYLKGSFFSKKGFTENDDWGNFPDHYEYHQFEKL